MAKVGILFLLCLVIYQINLSSQATRVIRQVVYPDDDTRWGGIPTTGNQGKPGGNNKPGGNRPRTSTTARPTTTTASSSSSTSDPNCEWRCLRTSEYNPVCGSNGMTYSNPGTLECARRCGLPNLRQIREGNCPAPGDGN